MPAPRYEDPSETIETDDGGITVGELLKRCEVLEPGLVYVRHPQHSNATIFEFLIDRASSLAQPFKSFAIVNDLTEASHRPRGEYADAIVKAANSVGVHWANVWPSNAFVRTVARFLSARLMRPGGKATVTWSFHDNVDAAVVAARAALIKAGGP
jgi:hypothetical protein